MPLKLKCVWRGDIDCLRYTVLIVTEQDPGKLRLLFSWSVWNHKAQAGETVKMLGERASMPRAQGWI